MLIWRDTWKNTELGKQFADSDNAENAAKNENAMMKNR